MELMALTLSDSYVSNPGYNAAYGAVVVKLGLLQRSEFVRLAGAVARREATL
jgi:hypothetical protein